MSRVSFPAPGPGAGAWASPRSQLLAPSHPWVSRPTPCEATPRRHRGQPWL